MWDHAHWIRTIDWQKHWCRLSTLVQAHAHCMWPEKSRYREMNLNKITIVDGFEDVDRQEVGKLTRCLVTSWVLSTCPARTGAWLHECLSIFSPRLKWYAFSKPFLYCCSHVLTDERHLHVSSISICMKNGNLRLESDWSFCGQDEAARSHEQLKYVCKCSFLEIFNEQITDLLEPTSTNLQVYL